MSVMTPAESAGPMQTGLAINGWAAIWLGGALAGLVILAVGVGPGHLA